MTLRTHDSVGGVEAQQIQEGRDYVVSGVERDDLTPSCQLGPGTQRSTPAIEFGGMDHH